MSNGRQEWRPIRLADAGRWLSGGTPLTTDERFWDGDIPWISAASLKEFEVKDSERRITRLGSSAGSTLVPAGTVLFVVRGMSLKSEFRVGVAQREVAFGQDCKAIRPYPEIDARFLAYSLVARSGRVLRMVDEAGHGTGRLPTDQLAKLIVGIPDKSEQLRLVEILDSVDESINSSGNRIAKLRLLRQGMLLDFFARHDGVHRRTARLHTLGKGDVPALRIGPFGSSLKGSDWASSGVPVITIGSLGSGRLLKKALLYVTSAKAVSLSPYQVHSGDIVFSRVADVGRSFVIREEQEGWLMSSNLLTISVDSDLVSPDFLQLALAHSPMVRAQLRQTVNSSGRDITSSRIIGNLMVPMPSLPEQLMICEKIRQIVPVAEAEESQREKLIALKQGLMEDLLVGQVRANAGEEASV
jgi:type I restriction enzyme S subunit